jgi:2-oxoglutarate dehydrogenase E2 component (dihydrolipoamide succinyltransferase)
MSGVMAVREEAQESFQKRFGIKLGFMSFFIKASVAALQQYPDINARIEGDEVVYNNFFDIGVAVSTEKGLMVPVLRNVDKMSYADIEKALKMYAEKARLGTISIDDLQGGTFTITNGGVFGSLLSTPILNPPQSGILGMHNIVKRPIALDDKVVIRPMMYLALSYDHRIVDGKESIGFLVHVKKSLEEPTRLLLDL